MKIVFGFVSRPDFMKGSALKCKGRPAGRQAIASRDTLNSVVSINTVIVTSFSECRKKEKRTGFNSVDQFAAVILSACRSSESCS